MSKIVLQLDDKTTLKVEAMNGDVPYEFFVQILNWGYVEKLEKSSEFEKLFVGIQNKLKALIDGVEQETRLTKETFSLIGEEIVNPKQLESVKKWFLENIQTLDNLSIRVIDDKDEKVITTLRRDDELFLPIFDQLWDKDYIIVALIERFQKHFKPNR